MSLNFGVKMVINTQHLVFNKVYGCIYFLRDNKRVMSPCHLVISRFHLGVANLI